jgi:hypothetical protein
MQRIAQDSAAKRRKDRETTIEVHDVREKSNMRKMLLALIALCVARSLFAQTAVQSASVTLNSVQLQHLKVTPVQLVAAPGSGKLLNLVSLAGQYKSGGTAYTLGSGGDFIAALGNAPLNIRLNAAGFIDQTSNHIQFNSPSGLGSQSSMENEALTISNNGSAEWSDGDGSVIVTVYYTVVDLQ